MAALTADRNTKSKGHTGRAIKYPVAASTTIFKGGLVATNAAGFIVMASDTASTKVVGVATEGVDNSAGSNGDKSAEVEEGYFLLDNPASGALVQADINTFCQVVDSQTVNDGTGLSNNIKAGIFMGLDEDGNAWVWVGPHTLMA